MRGFAFDDQIAPNGLEYHALFSLDFNLNLWLWRDERLYLFTDMRFWGQRATAGVTNPSQGAFDFSKREFDFNLGIAWNYWGPLEARTFAYSFNNLNRGSSMAQPTGYTDGVGLENRWYVGGSYPDLGTPEFDVARATFLSAGYYPTKDMVDPLGYHFKPGPFVRAYLTYDICPQWLYLYGDTQLIATQSWTPKLLSIDAGLAIRPFAKAQHLEFRLGLSDLIDVQEHELERSLYGAIRLIF